MSTDIRLAVRTLRQSPTFTLSAVLSLALGIGASTSVYSLVFTLFFAPPAGVDQPERLVRICHLVNGNPEGHEISYGDYLYYRDHVTVFNGLAGDGNVKFLTDTESGYELLTAVVSPSYFTVLGLRPRAGRFFVPSEETVAGQDQVVVLSHDFWQRRFAADPRTIGARLTLSKTSHVIVGVAPPSFTGSSAGWAPDIFVPISEADLANDKDAQLDLIGRLKPGRTLAEAQAEMMVLAERLEQAPPTANRPARLVVSTLRGVDPEARSEQARLPTLLVAAVASLIMITCVNLAGLLQTRHAARGKEIAIRLALGASRRHVVRQLLTESLLLSALGGAGGLVVAWWGKTLLERAYARETFDGARHLYPLMLDARAFLLTLLTAAATGVIFGLVPALQASRPMLVPALKDDASAPRRSRVRAVFLVVQVALSIVLLSGAGLMIQSARTVWQHPGIDAGHVAYFNINPAHAGYQGEKATRYTSNVRRRLESLQFVESVSFSWVPPPFSFATANILLPGQQPARSEDTLEVSVNWVSPHFFDTLRIPVLRGRGFEQRDIDHVRPLAVINEALARRLWREQDPVGRTLMVDGRPFEVVGIVRYEGLRAAGDTARPYLFCSDTGTRQQGSVFVRVKGDIAAALPTLRREILGVDAAVPIRQAMSLSSVIANQEADVPIAMGVLSFAGGLALLLTTLGLYSVVALWLGQRTREIGIRMALGATSGGIVTLVLREGLRLVLIGLPLGVGAALAAGRVLSSDLYGVSATDPATISGITALLAGVALFACYVPARRALRVDPVQALRHD
jgi:macrolide transport system ATP-binding/permease protein